LAEIFPGARRSNDTLSGGSPALHTSWKDVSISSLMVRMINQGARSSCLGKARLMSFKVRPQLEDGA